MLSAIATLNSKKFMVTNSFIASDLDTVNDEWVEINEISMKSIFE